MNIVNIRIELTNPFDRWDYFKSLGSIYGRIGKNTAWELDNNYYSPLLLDVDIKWSHKTDHAGIEIGIGLLGYGIRFRIYDTRHWDYEKDTYSTYSYTD